MEKAHAQKLVDLQAGFDEKLSQLSQDSNDESLKQIQLIQASKEEAISQLKSQFESEKDQLIAENESTLQEL